MLKYTNNILQLIVFTTILLLCSCKSNHEIDNNSSPETTYTLTTPQDMLTGEDDTATIRMDYSSTLTISDNDTRDVTIKDTVSGDGCTSPIIANGHYDTKMNVGSSSTFKLISTNESPCKHRLDVVVSGDNIKQKPPNNVYFVDQAIQVTPVLTDSSNIETSDFKQGNKIKVKFSPPSSWGSISGEQTYSVESNVKNMQMSDNGICTIKEPSQTPCYITATVPENTLPNKYLLAFQNKW